MVLDTVGPYRIRRKLRTTSLGVQYEATHGEDQRPVVVLVISPEYAKEPGLTKRLFTEARAADSVEHPCFIPVYDRGEHSDGTAYLVYEIPAGETLRERMRRERGPLPIEQALSLGQQLASGLVAAHARGLVHRDLQPQHILLTPELTASGGELAKLLEFGITSFAERWHATQAAAQCELIAIVGNPVYMSPEQCSGIGIVDDKTDVYSLGAILYHMLAGQPPFAGEGHGVLIGQHLFQEVPPLLASVPEIPHELAALIERMLIKPREQRPRMAQVLESLSRMRRPGAGSPARTPLPRARRPQPDPFGVPGRISASLQELRSFVGGPGWAARRGVPTVVLGAVAALSLGNVLVWQLGRRHGAPAVRPPTELTTVSVAAGLGPQPVRPPAPRLTAAASVPATGMPAAAAPPVPPVRAPHEAPAAPARVAVAPVAPVAPVVKIRWLLASEPPGALVLGADDGRVLGQTPWLVSRSAEPGLQIVRLHKPGWKDTRIILERDQSSAREVALEPLVNTAPKVSQLQRRPVPGAPAGKPQVPTQQPGSRGAPYFK